MLIIDGSQGEGGGQIIRSSLALSAVTGKPVTLTNIRAGRKKPGLQTQHLTAVNAAVEISNAEVKGACIGSDCISFVPNEVLPGEYSFRVSTAGSATLVLQTVLPALIVAPAHSRITLEGGTHNPMAPSFPFLQHAFVPQLNRMGPCVELKLERSGFFPAGGGRFVVEIEPAPKLRGIELLDRGEVLRRRVRALVANLPAQIGTRECDTFRRKSGWERSCFDVEIVEESSGPGNVVLVELECEHVTEVITGFGKRGLAAERVAAATWRATQAYLKSGVPVGEYLADQLMLPMCIAAAKGSPGQFRTSSLSGHSRTHIDILRTFLNAEIATDEYEKDVIVRFAPPQSLSVAAT